MSSEHDQAFVWVWLPGSVEPVVAGRLDLVGDVVTFIYGRSYLERPERVPLFLPELPLGDATLYPLDGMSAPGCIVDSGPDSWGQRVVLRRLGAQAAEQVDTQGLRAASYRRAHCAAPRTFSLAAGAMYAASLCKLY